MDAATVLVLVLTTGVVALLAWFEINSRRNEARKDSRTTLNLPDLEIGKKQSQSKVEADTQIRKAA